METSPSANEETSNLTPKNEVKLTKDEYFKVNFIFNDVSFTTFKSNQCFVLASSRMG